jgi:hypothetical protein
MRTEIQRQRNEITLLYLRATRLKPSLSNPKKFAGQSHKYDIWLPLIKAKLRVDGQAIRDTVA